MLLVTADRGGRLVFRHGVGVATVPSSGQPWTMTDHLPDGTEVPTRPGGS